VKRSRAQQIDAFLAATLRSKGTAERLREGVQGIFSLVRPADNFHPRARPQAPAGGAAS